MLRSILKTIYYNFKIFLFKDAVRLPLFIGDTTIIRGSRKGCVCIKDIPRKGMFSVGRSYGSYGCYRGIKSILTFGKQGVVVLHGRAAFCTEFKVNVGGTLELGKNFDANNGFNCICKKNILFGDNCLLGWDVTMMDSDGHKLLVNGKVATDKAILIGNDVWLGANTTVLKGTILSDNTVVGYGTIVSGAYDNNSIVVGHKGQDRKVDKLTWTK